MSEDRTQELKRQFKELIAAQDWTGALIYADEVLTELPDSARWHCNRGLVLMRLGELEGARACFQRALALDGEYEKAAQALRDVVAQLRERGVETLPRQPAPVEPSPPRSAPQVPAPESVAPRTPPPQATSAAAPEELKAGAAQDAEVMLARANQHRARKDLATAEACALEAVALAPDNAWAHLTLAELQRTQKKWFEAYASCNQALALDPLLDKASRLRDEIVRKCPKVTAPPQEGRARVGGSGDAAVSPLVFGAFVATGLSLFLPWVRIPQAGSLSLYELFNTTGEAAALLRGLGSVPTELKLLWLVPLVFPGLALLMLLIPSSKWRGPWLALMGGSPALLFCYSVASSEGVSGLLSGMGDFVGGITSVMGFGMALCGLAHVALILAGWLCARAAAQEEDWAAIGKTCVVSGILYMVVVGVLDACLSGTVA